MSRHSTTTQTLYKNTVGWSVAVHVYLSLRFRHVPKSLTDVDPYSCHFSIVTTFNEIVYCEWHITQIIVLFISVELSTLMTSPNIYCHNVNLTNPAVKSNSLHELLVLQECDIFHSNALTKFVISYSPTSEFFFLFLELGLKTKQPWGWQHTAQM